MIRQNIGILNALVRITCGFTLLTYASVKMMRRPYHQGSMVLVVLAAMKIAEGIVRYCPVTAVITNYMNNSDTEDSEDSEDVPKEEDLEEAINPS
ncbi:DUF2892 domain-containing protein [Aquibacillus halophilus]|uniref:DUF2892 domain-containing protein n=1 Tax=Aquibacillus halophilus TaxID=930132 RepID=A0A6A8DTK2_9BACI|nr:DUF2892 domain-containing protein [Aquibacillus halophilus]MRH44562.1 DUF2892 domain-containing protein [Aquibacillus halophilus]